MNRDLVNSALVPGVPHNLSSVKLSMSYLCGFLSSSFKTEADLLVASIGTTLTIPDIPCRRKSC